jgi:uroporphyrin-III C-methyltransferase/precorrin-2 dehydrogenase/sirohydrochlorin ferrochelatase
MSLFPIFLKLDQRPCLVVGAGHIAHSKIESLLTAGALVTVVALEAFPEIEAHAQQGRLTLHKRAFTPADLEGIFLVVAATDEAAVNQSVYREAVARNILCNAVDDPPHCDFYFPSIVTRGDLQIAISTAGESPAFAQQLRQEIDAQLPHDLGPWLKQLGALRRDVLAALPSGEARKSLLHTLAQRPLCESTSCPSRQLARESIASRGARMTPSQTGKVWLVGAGPGDPELLTMKAARLLETADVVLHDDLVSEPILDLARQTSLVMTTTNPNAPKAQSPGRPVLNVGKRCGHKRITQEEINAMLIDFARRGMTVVRLKCGDPLVFGRAAEEIDALTAAGVEFEIVPGITAAFAAAAALKTSLTDRRAASSVTFSSGHHAADSTHQPASTSGATRVIYMPGRDLTGIAAQLRSEGLPAALPCVLISRTAQPDQHILRSTLAELATITPGPAPNILLIGEALRVFESDSQNLNGHPDRSAQRGAEGPAFPLPSTEVSQ